MATTSLRAAKSAKNDEYYTQLVDIENELRHYKDQLAGKVIFCNCDDPFESNFFKYFAMNFNQLGLKKLIATCYDPSPIANTQISLFGDDVQIKHKGMKKFANHAYKLELDHVTDVDGSGSIGISDVEEMLKAEKEILKSGGKSSILTYLDGDGDFRSKECIELLEQSDVIVTNPPFSLFREYIEQLVAYDKKFLIIGNPNALHYKEVFKLIQQGKLWLGYKKTGVDMLFDVPESFAQHLMKTKKEGSGYRVVNGKVLGRASAVWFTNLDTTKRHEDVTSNLYKSYTPEEYPTYDNYPAIEVAKVSEIPEDYFGEMGVPDTFLEIYNPDQFEIIGIPFGNLGKEIGVTKNYRGRTDVSITKDGKTKCPYSRIIIKRKALNNDN